MFKTPFQLFKAEFPAKVLGDYNKLPAEQQLVYKQESSSLKLQYCIDQCKAEATAERSLACAKALVDYVTVSGQRQVALESTKAAKPRSRSASRSQQGPPTTASGVVGDMIRNAVPLVDPTAVLTTSLLETPQELLTFVKGLESRARKSDRKDGGVAEPLRKSARISEIKQAIPPPPPPPAGSLAEMTEGMTLEVSNMIAPLSEEDLAAPTPVPEEPTVAVPPSKEGSAPSKRGSTAARSKAKSAAKVSVTMVAEDEDATPLKPSPPTITIESCETQDSVVVVEETKNGDDATKTAAARKPRRTAKASDTDPTMPPKPAKKQTSLIDNLRRPALSNAEKKFRTLLNENVILPLALAAAARDPAALPGLFDELQSEVDVLLGIVEKELSAHVVDITKPEPFHLIQVMPLREVIRQSQKRFNDNVDECQTDFEEYLLHPIAQTALEIINLLDGYHSPAAKVQSEEELTARKVARDAEKQRKEELLQKQIAKNRAKEEALVKKEEEKRALQNLGRLDAASLVDELTLQQPSTLSYVQYSVLPLSDEEYDKALYVWSMLVSMPRAFRLSQFAYSLFVTAIKEDRSDNGLIEEIVRALLDVCVKQYNANASSSAAAQTPRLATRGKDWFDAAIEFIRTSSGTKKKPAARKAAKQSSSEDEDDDDDDDSSSDADDGSSSSESSTESSSSSSSEEEQEEATEDGAAALHSNGEAAEAAAPAAPKGPELSPMEAAVVETLDRLTELRAYASWANIFVSDRLTILQYLVQYALESDEVRAEAKKLFDDGKDNEANYEKTLREAKESAERDMKQLTKLELQKKKTVVPAGEQAPPPVDVAAQKAKIMDSMNVLVQQARIGKFTKSDQEDVGTRITPLGFDRYRRLYWRMPLDKVILVQTVPGTTGEFPIVQEPPTNSSEASSKKSLLDEEENIGLAGRRRMRGDTSEPATPSGVLLPPPAGMNAATQRRWGIVRAEHLPHFVQSLEVRGQREAPLRAALEPLQDYLLHLEAPHEGVRMTRSRAAAGGYFNKLRAL